MTKGQVKMGNFIPAHSVRLSKQPYKFIQIIIHKKVLQSQPVCVRVHKKDSKRQKCFYELGRGMHWFHKGHKRICWPFEQTTMRSMQGDMKKMTFNLICAPGQEGPLQTQCLLPVSVSPHCCLHVGEIRHIINLLPPKLQIWYYLKQKSGKSFLTIYITINWKHLTSHST